MVNLMAAKKVTKTPPTKAKLAVPEAKTEIKPVIILSNPLADIDMKQCPKCGYLMKHIKGNDFVCENGHGWSGYPPPL